MWHETDGVHIIWARPALGYPDTQPRAASDGNCAISSYLELRMCQSQVLHFRKPRGRPHSRPKKRPRTRGR